MPDAAFLAVPHASRPPARSDGGDGPAPPAGRAPGSSRPVPDGHAAQLAVVGSHGLSGRSEAELIAQVLAGSDPAGEVLSCGASLARLPFWQRRALGPRDLVRDHGLTPSRAARLVALWELADRWYDDDRPTLSAPRDALILLDDLRRLPRERIDILLVDARHRLLRRETVAVGTLNASRVMPRDVLAPALAGGAAGVLMAHNHPSGDPAPSRADREVTVAMRGAASVVGLALLDHLILARRGHYSFREAEGWAGTEAAAM